MESVEYRIMHSLEQTHWWFVGRQYLVRDQLAQLDFKGLKGFKILDVGCGTGIILKNLDNIDVIELTDLCKKPFIRILFEIFILPFIVLTRKVDLIFTSSLPAATCRPSLGTPLIR